MREQITNGNLILRRYRLEFAPLLYDAAVENEVSCRAAARAGAVFEATLRKGLVIGGQLHDAALFSFVRSDFG